jgi:hypothetical protein
VSIFNGHPLLVVCGLHFCFGGRATPLPTTALVYAQVVMYMRAGGEWRFPEEDDTEIRSAEEDTYSSSYNQAVAFPAAPSRIVLLVQCLHQVGTYLFHSSPFLS